MDLDTQMSKAKSRADSKAPHQASTIMIVDDHPIVRFGLRQLIESEPDLQVVGETDNAGDTLSY